MDETISKNQQIIDYESVIDSIEQLRPSQIKTPSLPIEDMIQEAENLYAITKKFETELTSIGLDSETIELLPTQAGALREAQSRWHTNYFGQSDIEASFSQQKDIAVDMKRDLNFSFRFAFRKNTALMAKVRKLGKQGTISDLIQNLNDYSCLGKENTQLLESISFDLTKLDDAAKLSDSLARLRADAKSQKTQHLSLRNIRNGAFALLKGTVDDIREHGKFIFRENPRVRSYFMSTNTRKSNDKKDKNDKGNKPNETDTNNNKPEIVNKEK